MLMMTIQCRKLSWISKCNVQFQHRCSSTNVPLMTKKRKEMDYEALVEKEKPYKKVLALKEILLKEPDQVISISELGYFRKQVGLRHKSRFIALVRKYQAFFDTYVDEKREIWVGFSPQAEALIEQENKLKQDYEAVAVQKLRKLLMMSLAKRLHVAKVAHLRRDLGFPDDFQKRFVYAYPEYFKVVEDADGPVVELTRWDSSLAITNLEKRALESGEVNVEGEPIFKMCTSRAFTLSHKQKAGLEKFQERPFISPYADSKEFSKNTTEFEKRQVALLHEILSMTLEKKTIVDYLTHFRKEYRLPKSVLTLLLKHHSIFYVSRKGQRFNVFLKEGYRGGDLIEKHEWMTLKQKFKDLMIACNQTNKSHDDQAVDKTKVALSSRQKLSKIEDSCSSKAEVQAETDVESGTHIFGEGSFSDFEEHIDNTKTGTW